jgi:hypothetical protein
MQANIYAIFHWTPDVFWNLSMNEFIAAMRGNKMMNDTGSSSDSKKGKLSKSEIDSMKKMMEREREKELNG